MECTAASFAVLRAEIVSETGVEGFDLTCQDGTAIDCDEAVVALSDGDVVCMKPTAKDLALADLKQRGVTPHLQTLQENVMEQDLEVTRLLLDAGVECCGEALLRIAISNKWKEGVALLCETLGPAPNALNMALNLHAPYDIFHCLIRHNADVNHVVNGSTPLMKASTVEIAELLVSNGADVNRVVEGHSALSSAAAVVFEKKSLPIVEFLIAKGARKAVAGEACPLTASLDARNVKVAAVLLREGFPSDLPYVKSRLSDRECKVWPFLFTCRLYHDYTAMLEQLLSRGDVDVDSDAMDEPPLHKACIALNLPHVTFLLDNGADPNKRASKRSRHYAGQTALMCAIQDDGAKVVSALLRAGANPNLEDTCSCLALSGRLPTVEVAEVLLEGGAHPDAPCHHKEMHILFGTVSFQFLNLLVQAGCDLTQRDGKGYTTLMHYVDRMRPRHVEVLLGCDKVDVHAVCPKGVNALMIACSRGHCAIVESLLSAGADATSACPRGISCLHRAASAGRGGVVRALLQAGALCDAEDSEGETALQRAVRQDRVEAVRELTP